MRLFVPIKKFLLSHDFSADLLMGIRRKQLHRRYLECREKYSSLASECGLRYEQGTIGKEVAKRLEKRGHAVPKRSRGDIHTLTIIPELGWHTDLFPDLKQFGPVSVFNPESLGFSWQDLMRPDMTGWELRKKLSKDLWRTVKTIHHEHPVDWIFCYLDGRHVFPEGIRKLVDETGIPIVNMHLDDRQSWDGSSVQKIRSVQSSIRELCSCFDLNWTSARISCDWYLAEGAIPVFLPQGYDKTRYHPLQSDRNMDVSFLGEAYGFRPQIVKYLKKFDIPISTFGRGWPGAGWVDDVNKLFNGSRINLGMGGIFYSEWLTNIKGRDFDIPGSGGGLYITSYNPDLTDFFEIGKEIVCYRSREELIELIRYYLAHPEEAEIIAQKGYRRCLQEHRWHHRYRKILEILGILELEASC